MLQLGKAGASERLDSSRAATKLSQTSREIISGIRKEQVIISNTTETHSVADGHL